MSDPYLRIIRQMRHQGRLANAAGVDTGTVVSASPLVIETGGTRISRGFFAVSGYVPAAGDTVAVKRIGDRNVILGKVEEL